MSINWNKLKPNKNCYACDITNNYICFECECLFIEKNYPNYSYHSDFGWLPKKNIKQLQEKQKAIISDNWFYKKGYYNDE